MTTVSYAIPFLNMAVSATPNTRSMDPKAALREYEECLIVSFASLRRVLPNADLRLITNHPLNPKLMDLLGQWDVRTVLHPFTMTVPEGLPAGFAGSLYYMDALSALDTYVTVLLDPDIVCTAPLPPALLRGDTHVAALPLDYEANRVVNGLSRIQTLQVLGRLGVRQIDPPIHWGGETYVIPLAQRDQLMERVTAAWADTLQHFGGPLFTCRTEEHLFNCALAEMGAIPLTGVVQRIWTSHRHRTVDGKEKDIPIWHLPAEKGRGFKYLSREVLDPSGWFWTADDDLFRRRTAQTMGMANRNPIRWTADTLGHVANSIMGRAS